MFVKKRKHEKEERDDATKTLIRVEHDDEDVDEDKVHGVPKKEDWRKEKLILNFLKIFYEAANKIYRSLYVTSNLFLYGHVWLVGK